VFMWIWMDLDVCWFYFVVDIYIFFSMSRNNLFVKMQNKKLYIYKNLKKFSVSSFRCSAMSWSEMSSNLPVPRRLWTCQTPLEIPACCCFGWLSCAKENCDVACTSCATEGGDAFVSYSQETGHAKAQKNHESEEGTALTSQQRKQAAVSWSESFSEWGRKPPAHSHSHTLWSSFENTCVHCMHVCVCVRVCT